MDHNSNMFLSLSMCWLMLSLLLLLDDESTGYEVQYERTIDGKRHTCIPEPEVSEDGTRTYSMSNCKDEDWILVEETVQR